PLTNWGTAHIDIFPGVKIDSGTGRIAMWGKSLGSAISQGICLNRDGGNTNPVMITSNASSADAITMYSDSSAGGSWSRGITTHWFANYDANRGYQGTQILATATGGGITMTGIGSSGSASVNAEGLYLDFIDILAVSGPITLNGDSSTSADSRGVTFGINNNAANAVRLGGWTANTYATGSSSITTPSGVTRDFASSSSSITINADSIWNNATTMTGVFFGTTGNVSLLPANLSSGLIQSTANFKWAHNTTHFKFEQFKFPVSPNSITFGRSTTTSNITLAPSISATGALSVTGGDLSVAGAVSAGSVDIKPSGTYSGAGSLTATNGAVSISGGTSVAPTGAISATGNITLSGSGAISNSTAAMNSSAGAISITSSGGAITTSAALSASGQVAITAEGASGDVTAGANITATGAGNAIVLKSKSNILTSANVTLQSNAGPITLWSDSDSVNEGGILITSGVSINSTGGNITLGGGGGSSIPTGYAKATSSINSASNGAYSGIRLIGSISSGAGNVVLRGQDSARVGSTSHNTGIEIEKPGKVTSTTGSIEIEGSLVTGTMTGTGNHIGLLVGWGGTASTGTNKISSTSGDITIRGLASPFSSSKAYGLWLTTNTIESVDGDISLVSSAASTVATELLYSQASVTSTNGSISVNTGTSSGTATFQTSAVMTAGGTITLGVHNPTFTSLSLQGTGGKIIEPAPGAYNFGASISNANVTVSTNSSSLRIGKIGSASAITLSGANSIAGDITIYGAAISVSGNQTATSGGDIEIYGSSISNSGTVTSNSGDVLLIADSMALSANVSASSGAVTISPSTYSLQIDLGTETSGKLSLVAAEINRLLADVVRIGQDGSNSGNINITAALTPTGTDTLALRTIGSVVGTSGSITIANLAIEAAEINLPGNNGVSGGLALSASGATLTYSQTSGTFTPSTVDLIDPVYGVPSKVVLSQVPTNATVDKFMAVAFNPPPVVTLQDRYSNTLTTSNESSDDYTVSATKASGPGNLSGNTSVTTSTTGVATFNNLSISDNTGSHTITFTVSVVSPSTAELIGSPSATTGTYNIQSDQTISFTSTAPSNPRVGSTGYTPIATASSSLTVAFTIANSSSAVCSISSGVVTYQSVGTCVINANQAGNTSYAAASQVQQSFSVTPAKLDRPAAPTLTATSSTLKSIGVSWTAVTDASSYTLRVYNSPGTGDARVVIVGVSGTSATINASNFPGIADGTEYYVSVSAIASSTDGNSDEGVKAAVTTNSPAVTPTIETQPISQSKLFGQSVTFSIGASKTDNGVLSYQWQKAGSNISGATSSSYSIANVAAADAAAYSVVVTNSLNGTTATVTSTSVNLAVVVNVTYDPQGGSSVSSATMNVGGSIATAPAPTKAGYTLSGWSRTTSGSVVSFTGGYAPADTSGFTLYAIWSANSNTFVYDYQGVRSFDYGSMLTGGSIATAPAPTKAGY
ncbi:MAG: hypothetical protein F2615_02465, partial [Actinobacteria bacterium]|nr:hypothetical protein [Actinomycetota bacterium]